MLSVACFAMGAHLFVRWRLVLSLQGTWLKIRRRFAALFWHESCELTLELLGYASAPTLGHGLRRGIGEDILFPFLQPIEDAQRRGLGRRLRYLEASVHVGVDGA